MIAPGTNTRSPTQAVVANADTTNRAYHESSSQAVTLASGRNISVNNPRIAAIFKIRYKISIVDSFQTKNGSGAATPPPFEDETKELVRLLLGSLTFYLERLGYQTPRPKPCARRSPTRRKSHPSDTVEGQWNTPWNSAKRPYRSQRKNPSPEGRALTPPRTESSTSQASNGTPSNGNASSTGSCASVNRRTAADQEISFDFAKVSIRL